MAEGLLLGHEEQLGRPDRADLADPLSQGQRRRAAGAPPRAQEPMPAVAWPAWADEWLAQPLERCQAIYVPSPEPTEAQRGVRERFPLGALVKATLRLAVPQAGTLGIVVGYHGDNVRVRQAPHTLMAIGLPCAWLEVVAQRGAQPAAPAPPADEFDDGDVPL